MDRLHDAMFAYDCCMQLADTIPATLCRLSRRYDCMPWSHFEQEAHQFPFLSSHLLMSAILNYFFIKKCMKVTGF